ncbi:MAG: ABC transporter substrate-binding protein [Calothrix sp. MO_167.B12]|nr:ABC transporter substrate-binding protein [Calothrix sp. MO_167.B12]
MIVYCTNPRCSQPQNNSNGDLSDSSSITARYCINCGMPLFLRNQRYIALEEIGRGGFGRTFRAHDFTFDDKECAVKVFYPPNTSRLTAEQLDQAKIAFKRGSQILRTLNHEKIPKVYDFFDLPAPSGEIESNNLSHQKLFFLIQDYIPGDNLKYELSRRNFLESDVLEVLKSLLQILNVTHKQGVLHRDIKPCNIIRHRDNQQLYLIDFDTAIKRDLEPGIPVEYSFAMGTVGYAPPEQLSGTTIDISADLYALAATCVHLLTNKSPTEICNNGGSLHIWRNYVPHVNNRLADILDRMLSLNPRDRFQSAETVLEAIDNLSITRIQKEEKETEISPPTLWVTAIDNPKNIASQLRVSLQVFWRRWRRWIGFLLLVMLALILSLFFYQIQKVDSNTETSKPTVSPSPQLVDNICSNYPKCPSGDNFSWGEEIMFPKNITKNSTKEKQKGTESFKKGEYKEAITHFKKSLNSNPNDPETLIYLNNALASLPSSEQSLKIAVNIPITSNTNTAEEMLRGVAHVQSEYNCGIKIIKKMNFQKNSNRTANCDASGINGRRLQVLITDYSKDKNKTESIYHKIVNNTSILGVIGPFTSKQTLNAGNIYSQKKLVLISPTSTAVRQIQNDLNPPNYALPFNKYVFRTSPTDSIAARDLAEFTLEQKYKKALIITDESNPYSKSLSGEFIKFLQDNQSKNIHLCDVYSRKTLVVNCIDKAVQEEADVAMLALSNNTVIRDINVLFYIIKNQKIKAVLGGDGIYEKDMIEHQTKGKLVLAVPWHRGQIKKSEFEEESQELWGTTHINWRTAMSYDATQAMAEGLRQDIYPTRENLFKKLSSDNFEAKGASTPVQFDSKTHDRKIDEDTQVGVLVKVQDSKFVLLKTPKT